MNSWKNYLSPFKKKELYNKGCAEWCEKKYLAQIPASSGFVMITRLFRGILFSRVAIANSDGHKRESVIVEEKWSEVRKSLKISMVNFFVEPLYFLN